MNIKRGEVYWADLPKLENSRIQTGKRPIIVTSNRFAAEYSPVIQYVPITTQLKRTDLPVHVTLDDKILFKPSMALVEQEGLIDKHRLMERIGKLSDFDMMRIDRAIIKQRGIDINQLTRQYNYA
jgi:mRNA interferase MazF